MKLLLDANLSPETCAFLVKTFHFDVIDLLSEGQGSFPDEAVVGVAKETQRIIVTFDLDFGEIYYLREKGKIGVIILRLKNQTIEAVNKRLAQFFREETKDIQLETSLVVLDERTVRILS